MNLPADVRIDALHALLGDQEQQRAALQLRIHDLERFKGNATDASIKVMEALEQVYGRLAVMDAIIPALLSSADPDAVAQAQMAVEQRWNAELNVGMDPASPYASAFESAAHQALPGAQLPR